MTGRAALDPSSTDDDTQAGLIDGRTPFIAGGHGDRHVVVLLGANALFKPLDKAAKPGRYARQVRRLLPPGCRFTILGYPEAPPQPATLDAMADEVAAALARVAPSPVPVTGISFGGLVAQRLAVRHSHRVSHLILLVSAHRFSANGWAMMERQFTALGSGDFETLVRENALLFRRPWYNALVRLKLWNSRGRLAMEFKDPDLILATYRGVFEDVRARDSSFGQPIGCPALVIGGTADQYFDADGYTETAALMPGSSLRLFPGETHMLPIERSGAVASDIGSFLGT